MRPSPSPQHLQLSCSGQKHNSSTHTVYTVQSVHPVTTTTSSFPTAQTVIHDPATDENVAIVTRSRGPGPGSQGPRPGLHHASTIHHSHLHHPILASFSHNLSFNTIPAQPDMERRCLPLKTGYRGPPPSRDQDNKDQHHQHRWSGLRLASTSPASTLRHSPLLFQPTVIPVHRRPAETMLRSTVKTMGPGQQRDCDLGLASSEPRIPSIHLFLQLDPNPFVKQHRGK